MPRCGACDKTFPTALELMEHLKTCTTAVFGREAIESTIESATEEGNDG